ncbi:uncharacterized protein LOC127792585 [Diospyros lotus]|uniref:uncharacterized protein LOC127792585 n=1 Tax=Diospyros lotus TaxID=55363 RepID=UPI00225B08DF|nr:uncharacterized protein LOC127792585 [Diospyros lotus]
MEGAGSRLGRVSSRYGGSAATFSGPVRKWKKQWIQLPSSSLVSYNHHNSTHTSRSSTAYASNLSGNGKLNSTNNSSSSSPSSAPLLCRWAPAADSEPPRRKFRYTPIAILEEQKKEAGKVDEKAKTGMFKVATTATESEADLAFEKTNAEIAFMEEILEDAKEDEVGVAWKESKMSYLNVDCCLTPH